MKAKLNDLRKSGLVWVRYAEVNAFVKFAVANGVFPKIGDLYNGGVIVMEG